MDNASHIEQMLELMLRPAFCVEAGHITAVNAAAQQYHIKKDTPIASLICTGWEGYLNYQGGEVAVTLDVDGCILEATVKRIDEADIFLLKSAAEDDELRGMTLVANDVRRSLSDSMLLIEQIKRTHPQVQAHMDRSLYQILRMTNNVSDTYRLSTEGATKIQLENISSIVGEIMEKTQTQLQQTNRSLIYHGVRESLICAVDERLLTRAIYNLLSNAIKYSPEGSVLEASLKAKGDKIYLSITNPLIPNKEEEKSTFFSRHLRTPGITDADAGVGLGITLARKVALAHGGTLLIEHNDKFMTTTLSIKIRLNASPKLRNTVMDYSGGFDNSLIELADILPPEAFSNKD